ncbi:MAG: hypothetical protein WBF33_25165, partial [Candidatus Nitrosopolaris sp.]
PEPITNSQSTGVKIDAINLLRSRRKTLNSLNQRAYSLPNIISTKFKLMMFAKVCLFVIEVRSAIY